jgi:hypothetical protein
MPKTTVNCPSCRQPLAAEIDQIFDMNADPTAKQKLISGAFNFIQCPRCGYQGNLSTMVVYHDPEKELLLTFVPAELGLPRNEQERLIGNLINQVVNKLPPEKRKAYILRPQSALTMQGLVERILEADGITREMIQAQQQKLNLIQRLLTATSPDVRAEIARQEDQMIDAEFFALLSRIAEAAIASGDQNGAQQLVELQQSLLPVTTFGKQLQEQSQEIEAAVKSLQEMGENLTREGLLEVVIKAPSETRIKALVSLARPGMDYQFFQLLSDRIDRARGDGRTRLIELRETLLRLTQEVDRQVEARQVAAQQLLGKILQAPDVTAELEKNLPAVDDFFLQEVSRALQLARQQGDLDKINKLQTIVELLQSLSAAAPEVEFIEALVEAPDETSRQAILEANRDKVTPELLNSLVNIVAQVESSEDKELAIHLKAVHRQVLRFSMQANLST